MIWLRWEFLYSKLQINIVTDFKFKYYYKTLVQTWLWKRLICVSLNKLKIRLEWRKKMLFIWTDSEHRIWNNGIGCQKKRPVTGGVMSGGEKKEKPYSKRRVMKEKRSGMCRERGASTASCQSETRRPRHPRGLSPRTLCLAWRWATAPDETQWGWRGAITYRKPTGQLLTEPSLPFDSAATVTENAFLMSKKNIHN